MPYPEPCAGLLTSVCTPDLIRAQVKSHVAPAEQSMMLPEEECGNACSACEAPTTTKHPALACTSAFLQHC